MTIAIILFAMTYILLLTLPRWRAYIALGSAALFVVLGILPVKEVLGTVDFKKQTYIMTKISPFVFVKPRYKRRDLHL